MSRTNRRTAFKIAVAGGVAAGLASAQHQHEAISGPLASATVSFGQWQTGPAPLDRFPNVSPRNRNVHQLTPNEVQIKAGGSVNFVISGFHHVLIYDDGTQPTQINTSLLTPTTGTPAGVPLINDPNRRIYRGLDPSTVGVQDRVEVVQFSKPGIFFVTCGVLPHFNDGMFGFVRVLP